MIIRIRWHKQGASLRPPSFGEILGSAKQAGKWLADRLAESLFMEGRWHRVTGKWLGESGASCRGFVVLSRPLVSIPVLQLGAIAFVGTWRVTVVRSVILNFSSWKGFSFGFQGI